MAFDSEKALYENLFDQHGQYSLWPDYKAVSAGWREAGKKGSKAECLAYVGQLWTDMRPLSPWQKKMGVRTEIR